MLSSDEFQNFVRLQVITKIIITKIVNMAMFALCGSVEYN